MTGCVYLLLFLAGGLLMVRWLLPRHRVLNRIWLGLCLGLLMLMWFPALCAFFLKFSYSAHWAALGLLALCLGGAYLARDAAPLRLWAQPGETCPRAPLSSELGVARRVLGTVCFFLGFHRAAALSWGIRRESLRRESEETRFLRQLLWVLVPFLALSVWLQYTHVMRVDEWGNWNVGQSTYGDLPMHLAFITGLKNAPFPPEYPFYPGQQLSYPFLADSLSTTFYLFGWSLQLAAILPAVLMMGLCCFGVMVLYRGLTAGKRALVLAALLFFLNGGLGFLYDFDQAAGYENGTLTVVSRVQNILYGYYKTPTNQPDPNNLRWSNLIADLLVPQRTLLGGYCMVIPCFYLLFCAFNPMEKKQAREKDSWRTVLLLGLWGGALPLVHTHSFLALGLTSAGLMAYDLLHGGNRLRALGRYACYAAVAIVISAPQLILFTFRQALGGQGTSFLRFQFNWVNNPNGSGMRDFYFWFYIKNIGLPFIGLILALFEKNRQHRRLFAGAFAIILAAELVRFQPNEYDNNKLFYLAWLLCCPIVADYAGRWWRMLRSVRARPLIALGAAVTLFLSAGLTLWRECISDYQAFNCSAVECGEYIRDNTEEDALFLTGYSQHLNPVDSIAGRRILCGPDLWLYWHGISTQERHAEIAAFYADPQANLSLIGKYGVDYIYVSSYERSSEDYSVDIKALDRLYQRVFENSECVIWKVPEG